LKPRAAAPAPAPKPSPRTPEPTATAGTAVVGTPQAGIWVVQVHALKDRTVASGIVQRLIAKNYPAFLVASGPPTGTYKVHVGRFKDRDDAQRVVERLKREEQFNSWITR
jgi:cell division septation protein DedD